MSFPDLHDLIGRYGTDITAWPMSVRALLIFLYGLVLVRVAGRRIFNAPPPWISSWRC